GPTKLLTDALKKLNLKGLSLLDIGGGIGPIQLELIPHGIKEVTNVEASVGYINIAKSEAKKQHHDTLIEYRLGDFVEESEQIELHEIVTLDKVICCYPQVDELLKTSLSKATKYYALAYPQTHWLAHLSAKLVNLRMKIQSNPFRTFIHSSKFIDNTIKNAGFSKIYSEKTMLSWQVHVYEK
ncbi:MAG: hypothetical protein KUG51_03740, partial [Urechidicola sp.]|nr:hypothetical protein [Urechidicola sp.]